MDHTLTFYAGSAGQEERRRRRRGRIFAGIMIGLLAAALAPRTPEPKAGSARIGVQVPPISVVRFERPIGPSMPSGMTSTPPGAATVTPPQQPSTPPLPAKAIVAPSRLDFGDGPLVRTSAPQLATVRNSGGTPIERVKIRAGKPFLVASNCGRGIAPGAECVVAVGFAPNAAGTFDRMLVIDTGNQHARVALQGRVTEPRKAEPPPPPVRDMPRVLCFQPESLTFIAAGTKSVTLTNPESTPLEVTNIHILRKTTGTSAIGYDVDTTSCRRTLLPGQQCRFEVRARTQALLLHETVQIAVDYLDPAGKTRSVHRATNCRP
jgi:hypothetical protein